MIIKSSIYGWVFVNLTAQLNDINRPMARPLRIEFADALYHITSRGNRQEAIYEDDTDRNNFLSVFEKVCTTHNWRCHAW